MQCTKMNMSNGIQHTIRGPDNFAACAENQLNAVKKIQYGLKMANRYVNHVVFHLLHNEKFSGGPTTLNKPTGSFPSAGMPC